MKKNKNLNTEKNKDKKIVSENPIKLISIDDKKIVFESSFVWAVCLGAFRYEKLSFFFLSNNSNNKKKIKLILDKNFNLKINENSELNQKLNSVFFEKIIAPPSLRKYQKDDIEFLSKLDSGAILSETRTGKTPVSLISAWKKWKTKKILIITPSIVQNHWQNMVFQWLNEPSFIITFLSKNDRAFFYNKFKNPDIKSLIIIISKDTFKLDYREFIINFDYKDKNICIIVDEAHFLRNTWSKQTQSILSLRRVVHKLVLTGTPVVNKYSDFFGILNFLKPDYFYSYSEFVKTYFLVSFKEITIKTKNNKTRKLVIQTIEGFLNEQKQKELLTKIGSFSVRRKQQDVMLWLPKIIRQKEFLTMDNEQQKKYNEIILKWKKERTNTVELLTTLKTVTLYPKLLECKKEGVKFEFLVNYLIENENEPIIVFSTRSSTFLIPLFQYIIKKRKIKIALITGQTKEEERQKLFNEFKTGILNILLCHIGTTNVGIDLSWADTIIFADRSYSPAENEQAESRFLPPTKQDTIKKSKLIIDLICKGTIDYQINHLLEKKINIIKTIIENPELFIY